MCEPLFGGWFAHNEFVQGTQRDGEWSFWDENALDMHTCAVCESRISETF